ncbi:hypothetical protein EYR40_000341 [Pleurotus pulmonarius]|nr:hypothetical protein EYR40_000341 [Pleurotus pulmonarius]
MSDDALGSCCASICAVCCICGEVSLFQWCTQKSYGSGSSTAQRGCCGRCCSDSFDADDFDRAVKEDLARTKATEGDAVVNQPRASGEMTAGVAPKPAPSAT